jgi:thiamine kinase-like enzyme
VASHIFRYLTNNELKKIAAVARNWHQLIRVVQHIRNAIPANIPCDQRAIIADAVIQAFEISGNMAFTMAPIIGGFSPWSSTYKIQLGNNALVLRLTSQQRELACRMKETRMAAIFSQHSISPQVFYANAYDGIIIQQFIHSIPRWHYQLDTEKTVKIAEKIRAMHHINYQPMRDSSYDATGFIVERKRLLLDVLQQHPVFILQQQSLIELEQLAPYLKNSSLAHNNLHLNNILYDGEQFWIIDLESASKGDFSLDLAMLTASARLKPEIEKQLLTVYFQTEPDQQNQARYVVMKAMSFLLLSSSFFANCQNHDQLLQVSVDSLPNFMSYDPKVHGVVDPNSSSGKYSLSIMLAKEALHIMTGCEYRDAIQFLTEENMAGNKHFWGSAANQSQFLPGSFSHRVFNTLKLSELQTAGRVCQQWRILSRATFFSRKNKLSLPLDQCPATVRSRIQNSLSSFFAIDPLSPIEIRPLNGGLSPWANIFFVAFNQRKYVLRVLNTALTRKEKLREIATLQLFSDRGVTPLIEHTDLANGIILMTYVENNPKWMMPISKTKLLELARLLHCMHSVKLPNDENQFASTNRMQQFEDKVSRLDAPRELTDIFSKVVTAHAEILLLLKPKLDFTLCHYDLNPWNLLNDGQRLWAIDWEFSQLGHPLFDLATIANFLRLSPENDHYLLTCYYAGKISAEDKQIYYLMKQLSYLRYAICSLGLCDNLVFKPDLGKIAQLPPFQQFIPGKNPPFSIDKSTDEGRMMIAVMFAKEALQNMQSPNCQEAVRLLQTNQLQPIALLKM